MIDAALPVIDAIVAVLKADTDVAAIVGTKVFVNRPPQSAKLPYISMGDPQTLSFANKADGGTSTIIQIDGWLHTDNTDARFMRRGLELRAAIVAALDQTRPTIAGFYTQQVWVIDQRVMRDPDGVTLHVIVTVQADVTPDP